MTIVGIISDTHGLLRDEAIEALKHGTDFDAVGRTSDRQHRRHKNIMFTDGGDTYSNGTRRDHQNSSLIPIQILKKSKFDPTDPPLPTYVITILATVYNEAMNSLVVSTPALARDEDFKNYIAQTLLDLARAGRVDPRDLTLYTLAKGKEYANSLKNNRM